MKRKISFLICLVIAISMILFKEGFLKDCLATDDYPSKNIEFVVGWAPGGGTDILARIVVEKINKYLEGEGKKGRMFVTNKPGSSGVIGLAYVVKSKPDGYTIGSVHGSNTYIAFLNPENVPYTINDFEPLCNITRSLYGLYVQESSQLKTYTDLLEYAKKNPGSLSCAIVGKTSTVNVYFELLKLKEKVDIRGVPFSGAGPAATALLGGHVDMTATNDTSIGPHVKAGKVRILVQLDEMKRYPNIPTIKDIGLEIPLAPNGCGVPIGVPRDRFKKLSDLFEKALNDKEVIEKLENAGEIPYYLKSQQFKDFIVRGFSLVELIKDKLK
jgi:tripartite-type tricarboxylate transporter receptor subunit TctC